MEEPRTEFSKFRSFFWPIHKHELKKFVPMFLFFFFIAFNYYLLRLVKDALIITQKHSSAEVLPFLKTYAILPSSILFAFAITKIASKCNREKLFYICMSFFLSFFLLFAFVIYPFRDSLCLNGVADYLQTVLPAGLNGLIAIIRYWMFSLFYVMAESWSTIMVSVLMWGFANEVIKLSEAKRFYALFSASTNLSGVISGYICMTLIKKIVEFFSPFLSTFNINDFWDQQLLLIIGIIIICGLIATGIYRWLNTKIFTDHLSNQSYSDIAQITNKKKKYKMSFLNSLKYVVKSRYILSIAVLVLSYNVIINLTEFLWKANIKEFYPSSTAFTDFNSKIQFFNGLCATLFSYFLSGNLIRLKGWRFTALITPLMFIITSALFFSALFAKNNSFAALQGIIYHFGSSPLTLAVMFGSVQNVLARSSKFTFFDDTKEMAFIPLNAANKLKAKAAIDGIGSRLGKSGSSFIIQVLLVSFASVASALPVISIIILSIIVVWMSAIFFLGKKFSSKVAKQAIFQQQQQAINNTENLETLEEEKEEITV